MDDRHGNAVERAVPDGSSTNVDGDSALVLTPGEPLATDIRVPGSPCPQPWGIDTTPGLIASVTRLDRRALSSNRELDGLAIQSLFGNPPNPHMNFLTLSVVFLNTRRCRHDA